MTDKSFTTDLVDGTRSAATWKIEGNKHFELVELHPALRCYRMGLNALNKDGILTRLCTNMSLCHFNAQNLHRSLLFAAMGTVMDGTSEKAWYRAAVALEALNEPQGAFTCLRRMSSTSGASYAAGREMMRRLISQCGSTRLEELTIAMLATRMLSLIAPLGQARESVEGANLSPSRENWQAEVLALKACADESFKAAQYDRAIQQYLGCLSAFTARDAECSPVDLLSSMAQCQLNLDDVPAAALSALTAVTLDTEHSSSKAAYRLSEALLRLELFELAVSVCDAAMTTSSADSEALGALKARIETAAKLSESAAAAADAMAAKMIEGALTEREKEEVKSISHFHNSITMTNNLLSCMPEMMRKKALKGTGMTSMIETRVVEFHLEFLKEGRLPSSSLCDPEKCRSFLHEAYEVARSLPRSSEFRSVHKTAPVKDPRAYAEAVMERFRQEISKDLLSFLATAKLGDMFFNRNIPPYDYSLLQSMSNAKNKTEFLRRGTTHVAVGFVDLGSLFRSKITDGEGVLKWVGYEVSAYCVAKTRVVAEMMRIGADVSSVLQVSYSSGWSRRTKEQFREALMSLLTPAAVARCESEVAAFYRHWLTHDVSLSASISKWLDAHTDVFLIANFKRKKDRLDFTQYCVTGQLLDCEFGSVVMFANPHQIQSLAFNSSFLHSVPNKGSLFGKDKSFVEVAVDQLAECIGEASRLVRAGEIELSIRLGSVDLSFPDRIAEIRAMQPRTMSWSNVCDYFHPKDFHKLARQCSGQKGTVHFAYSMNWPYCVFGTDLLDYQLLMGDGEEARKTLQSVIASSKTTLSRLYDHMGLTKYLHSPPINVTESNVLYFLCCHYHEKYSQAFFDFSVDNERNLPRANVGSADFDLHSVLNRMSTILSFIFSYDLDVKWADD